MPKSCRIRNIWCHGSGLDDVSKRLGLEVQNVPTMTAHAEIQFVKVFLQSKKASDTLTSEAKAYAGQTNPTSASHVLANSDDAEVNNASSYKKFNKKRKQANVSKSEYDYPPSVYRYYVRKLGLQLSEVPKWLNCKLLAHKSKQCLTNKKDSKYDPKCELILQDANGTVVEENGKPIKHPPRWVAGSTAPYVKASSRTESKSDNHWKEKRDSKGSRSTSPHYKKQRSGS